MPPDPGLQLRGKRRAASSGEIPGVTRAGSERVGPSSCGHFRELSGVLGAGINLVPASSIAQLVSLEEPSWALDVRSAAAETPAGSPGLRTPNGSHATYRDSQR